MNNIFYIPNHLLHTSLYFSQTEISWSTRISIQEIKSIELIKIKDSRNNSALVKDWPLFSTKLQPWSVPAIELQVLLTSR